MTDRSQMFRSGAYAALSPSARKVLAVIEREAERKGGVVTISRANIAKLCGVARPTTAYALKQLVALGFYDIRSPRPRHINTFRVSNVWQSLDPVEARQMQAQARAQTSIAKPRVIQRQEPSLPRLPLDDAR